MIFLSYKSRIKNWCTHSLEVIVSTAKEVSVFGLFRTVFFHIRTEYGELRRTPNTNTFCSVLSTVNLSKNLDSSFYE